MFIQVVQILIIYYLETLNICTVVKSLSTRIKCHLQPTLKTQRK